MNSKLQKLLSPISISIDADEIYLGIDIASQDQASEVELRERVAARKYENYFQAISQSHSIPVMDVEVDQFLAQIPEGGVVLDVGGCWGWHWRRLASTRPDVGVVIVDFVRSNLTHAQQVLGSLIGNQVVLMHADATNLPFTFEQGSVSTGFDGVWTVQIFQHIPNFEKAVGEAHRVLRKGGYLPTILSMCSLTFALSRGYWGKIGYFLFGWPMHLWNRSVRLRRYSGTQLRSVGQKLFSPQNCALPIPLSVSVCLAGWMHCSPIMLASCTGSLVSTPFIAGNSEWP